MRVYVILGLSIMFFLLGLDTLLQEPRDTFLAEFDIDKKAPVKIFGAIFIMSSLLGFFNLWKNDAFKKK